VGGAERAQRRRKQQQLTRSAGGKAVSAARASGDRRQILTMVVVVAVIAAVVIGGVLWQRSRSAPPDAAPVERVDASYPVTVDGAVVVAGESDAEVTVDIYEDFLCPACGVFEARDSEKIERALGEGTIQVRYHVLNLLDQLSNPPGYSLDAANAAVCAAEAGQFPTFHASLFADQPSEGGRGYSLDQLVQLGRDAGITGTTFESCVRDGTHRNAVTASFESARNDSALKREGSGGQPVFGTPTVVADGKLVDLGNEDWLADAIAAAS
jgi:protein-disulfide isomerase